MKKYSLFFIILLTVSCDKSNQFTSVEGYVTDYYSKQPVPGISLEVSEIKFFDPFNNDLKTDTVTSDTDGYYYNEFYNKEDRWYEIKTLPNENYYYCEPRSIIIGQTNRFNFAVKPLKTLTLKCYNQSNTFNWLYIYSFLNDESFLCYPCEGLTVYNFKIVNEESNHLLIQVSHYYEENKVDTTKTEHIEFFSAKNDTTINYYY
jgi:hypothetical protein